MKDIVNITLRKRTFDDRTMVGQEFGGESEEDWGKEYQSVAGRGTSQAMRRQRKRNEGM